MDYVIRCSLDGAITLVWDTETDTPVRIATCEDIETFPIGEDLGDDESAQCDNAPL